MAVVVLCRFTNQRDFMILPCERAVQDCEVEKSKEFNCASEPNICDPEVHPVEPVRAHASLWTVYLSAQSAIGPRGLAVSARLHLPRLLPFMIPRKAEAHNEPTVSWKSRRRREILCIHSARKQPRGRSCTRGTGRNGAQRGATGLSISEIHNSGAFGQAC